MTKDEKHAIRCLRNRIENDLKASKRQYHPGTVDANILHGRMMGLQRVLLDMKFLGLIDE